MAHKNVRKLVSLSPETAAAVEQFRHSDEMREVRCVCGNVIGQRDGPANESDTLRRLIEIALAQRALAAGRDSLDGGAA